MAEAVEHLQDAPHDLVLALDRLIGVGIGADGDRARCIARRRELPLEQLRRVGLGEQLGFEIEPGREPEIGMRGPCEAVDAAVLAAAIGVDRAVERNIGRVIACNDRARLLDRDLGLERRQLLERLPAVVERCPRQRLVAAGRVRLRPAAAPALAIDGHVGIGRRMEIDGRRTCGNRGRQFRRFGRLTNKTARRRDGLWQGGQHRRSLWRRRASDGCGAASHVR